MIRLTMMICALVPVAAVADVPRVLQTTGTQSGGTWRFDVTVAHPDEGWDHYADAWEVAAPDGTVLGTRALEHPHEAEQPFTRALGGVEIPGSVTEVVIWAHDSVHGWGEAVSYTLPR